MWLTLPATWMGIAPRSIGSARGFAMMPEWRNGYSMPAGSHWGRDRSRGPGLPLPQLVKMQTSETADFFGFADRGRLKPGLRADVNLIDFDRLRLHQPEVLHDLPAGGRRLVQRVDGYRATLVAGTPVFENGADTGARPGRLVRAGR
jgi:N-acyl-D-amino-acid deacylase